MMSRERSSLWYVLYRCYRLRSLDSHALSPFPVAGGIGPGQPVEQRGSAITGRYEYPEVSFYMYVERAVVESCFYADAVLMVQMQLQTLTNALTTLSTRGSCHG